MTGGNVRQEIKALGLDIGGAAIPGVTGLGMMGRVANKADNITDLSKAADNNLVCRGGNCSSESFLRGSNEYKAGLNPSTSDPLTGISVTTGGSIDDMLKIGPISQYGEYGKSTIGSITSLGGKIVPDSIKSLGNPFHANLDGLSAGQLETLFKPVQKNPYKFKK